MRNIETQPQKVPDWVASWILKTVKAFIYGVVAILVFAFVIEALTQVARLIGVIDYGVGSGVLAGLLFMLLGSVCFVSFAAAMAIYLWFSFKPKL